MINIIGGTKKRTKILVPPLAVRPTSAQKRESIFSIIESYGKKHKYKIYKNTYILDLFAGSGALGLEAISRGSIFGYFFENNANVIYHLKKNCIKVCQNNEFKIIKENILETKFTEINKKISIVFIDPPYKMNPFEKILQNLNESNILSVNAIIILECSQNSIIKIPSNFFCVSKHKYGKTKIYFLINKKDNL